MSETAKYDPDDIASICESMTPARFGILVAREMCANPNSHNWGLVDRVIESIAGWGAEPEYIRPMIARIAEADDD